MTSESVDFAVNGGVEGSSEWPNSLYQFAWFQDRDDKLQDLVDLAEPEEWGYDSIPGEHPYPYPVLFNYLQGLSVFLMSLRAQRGNLVAVAMMVPRHVLNLNEIDTSLRSSQ